MTIEKLAEMSQQEFIEIRKTMATGFVDVRGDLKLVLSAIENLSGQIADVKASLPTALFLVLSSQSSSSSAPALPPGSRHLPAAIYGTPPSVISIPTAPNLATASWLSRPDAEARTRCRAYARMRYNAR